MHIFFALLGPFVSAFLAPVTGGELEWVKQTPTTPVTFGVNDDPDCRVDLLSYESQAVAQAIIEVVDNGAPSMVIAAQDGGFVRVLDRGDGDVSLAVYNESACRVVLLASEGEPDFVIDAFEAAAS